jgi:CheY-like chemotaxis protein
MALERLTVLIVDDNQNMRLILRTILRGLGVARVEEARDAGEVFERLGSVPIDAVFIDINMPLLDGIELTRMIRTAKDSPQPRAPIIMCSSHSERSRVKLAIDAGANDFVVKPVSANAVLTSLKRVIAKSAPPGDESWEV